MNERDSEQVSNMLTARGYKLAEQESEADVILLNTCSVRDMAEQKAIGKMGMLRKLRRAKPHLVIKIANITIAMGKQLKLSLMSSYV